MSVAKREFELRPKDVTIQPPAARLFPGAPIPLGAAELPTPWEDLYKDSERERKTLEKEKRELVDFSSQICSLCLSLAKMMQDQGKAAEDGTITIPKALHEQMIGAGITVGTDVHGNPFVKIKERGRTRIELAQ